MKPTHTYLFLRSFALAAAAAAGLAACSTAPMQHDAAFSPPKLTLIGHATLAHRMDYKGTVVGGLSGIDYDAASGTYYLLSDDRSDQNPSRYYTATIALTATSMGTPQLQSVTSLKKPDGSLFGDRKTDPQVADPEAIRYLPASKTFLWTSEGDKGRMVQPFLREARLDGSFVRELPLLDMFKVQKGAAGSRDNLVFEGLTLNPDGKTAWLGMEAARFEDGDEPSVTSGGGPARFTLLDLASGAALKQVAYQLDAIPQAPVPATGFADNGVPELLALDAHRLLVLERAYMQGVGNSLRLYLVDTRSGSDVLATPALKAGNFTPVSKQLLLDFGSLKNAGLPRLDNTEGMTWGPVIGGKRTLIFVSDDNFNKSQITQFIAFLVE